MSERNESSTTSNAEGSAALARAVGWTAALALAAAACWDALVTAHVTVAAPPSAQAGRAASPHAELERYYAWFATTLGQERWILALLTVGLAGVALTALTLVKPRRQVVSIDGLGAAAVLTGAALWVLANILQAGGDQAIALMASHDNPIDSVNEIAFTIDGTTTFCEAVASALLALGIAALAVTGKDAGRPIAWRGLTGTVAAASLAIALSRFATTDQNDTWVTLCLGVVLLPTWLIWTTELASDADTYQRHDIGTPLSSPA